MVKWEVDTRYASLRKTPSRFIAAQQQEREHLVSNGLMQMPLSRISFIGNYLPRLCGIATFTYDLCEAVSTRYPEATCIAIPVNDTAVGYAYPPRVRFELAEKDIDSYRRAADFLNINNVDLVSLQFEYGVFGGCAGSHILALLRELRMPIVTTLHTILNEPDPDQRRVLEEVAALSDRLVVMSARGAEFLSDIYGVATDKIDVIPHGIHDVPFIDPSFNKDLFGVEGKIVLLSFGLLSANKGDRDRHLGPARHCSTLPRAWCTSFWAPHTPTCSNTRARATDCRCSGWPRKRAWKPMWSSTTASSAWRN